MNSGVVASRGEVIPFVIINDCLSRYSLHAQPHFVITQDGLIHQYIDIECTAWVEWAIAEQDTAQQGPVIQDHRELHPSLYSVFIAHEPWPPRSGQAEEWPEQQFHSTLRLHEHIRRCIARLYGRWFPLSRYHVIRASDVKPGIGEIPNFPWEEFYEALIQADEEFALPDTIIALETLKNKGAFL